MGMTRYLRVTMPDGSKWDVPLDVVFGDLAEYFSESRGVSLSTAIDCLAGRPDEDLIDWAENNMDWSDVSDLARMVTAPPSVNFDEGWVNGPKEIVKH